MTLNSNAIKAWRARSSYELLASAARPLPAIDGLLAATALHHDMTLVSRNVKDFIGLNLDIINPWDVQ